MKRRWALLLALSLTFASIPVTGAGAAEAATTADTEIVTEIAAEEIPGEGVSVEGEAVVPTEEDKDETAADAGTTTGQEVAEKIEETVDENAAADATTTETEIAAEGITDTEIAAVVEPEVITEEKEAKMDASINSGWVDEGGSRYYYGTDGKAVTGWQTIEGKRYFFNPNGTMKTGWMSEGGSWYYLSPADGAMAVGFVDYQGARYYFNSNGKMATGWIYDQGSWYYANNAGAIVKGWFYENGTWYLLDPATGRMARGFVDYQGARYYFYNNGKMATGWVKDQGHWYFFNSKGAMVKGWLKDGGRWYFLTNEGKMRIGWMNYQGAWYYFNPNGTMATGWKSVDGKWYLLNSSGAMERGWKYLGNKWYYLKSDGAMATYWEEIGNNWYYFNASSGVMVNTPGYCKSAYGGGSYYFFYSDGRLGTGKGWKKSGGYWYYTNADGVLYRNCYVDGYYLDENGRYGDAMDIKAQGYSSSTNYLILVDKSTFTVRVYKGSKGKWTRIKDWACTHGGSDTPNGVFTIDDHVTKRDATWGWADFDFSSAAFACHISAGNYFHSILFDKGTRGNPYSQSWKILDDELRTTYSHGCIRLTLENAEWVWDNIPFGTKVVVYNS